MQKKVFYSRLNHTHTTLKTSSSQAPPVMASLGAGRRAEYSTLSVSPKEPVVSVDWLHANLTEPDLKVSVLLYFCYQRPLLRSLGGYKTDSCALVAPFLS